MSPITIDLDPQIEEIIALLAIEQRKSKSDVAQELIVAGISQSYLPTMAKLYQKGKVSLKVISQLTGIPPSDVIGEIVQLIQ